MATPEDFTNPPPPPVEQPLQKQQHFTTLPQYPEMIMAAIEALNDKNGSNKSAISKQIETVYPNLPPSHTTLLTHHLNRMKQSGELVLVKNNYMKPDPNAPPKRGRGRPPKPKEQIPPGAVLQPPRPRGRPPKPKDTFASLAPSNKKSSAGSGRPRGRPPKMAKTAVGPVPASAPPSSQPKEVKRGRGRPPKVKPAVAPVAG